MTSNPSSFEPDIRTASLRQLVEARIGLRWESWSQAHPNLARAVNRMQLAEAVIRRLEEDPELVAALRQADLDEAQLAAIGRLVTQVEKWISRVMPV